MPWVFLLVAGALEIVWAVAMKQSDGLSRPRVVLMMVLAMAGSFGLLALAMRQLPLGTSYMIWTGIGAVGAFVAGVWLFGESLSLQRTGAALLIVAGMVWMKLAP